MKKKVLLTGAYGFVGQGIVRYCADVFDIVPSPSLRGMDEDGIKRMIEESGAEAVIHTAAISGIPECESDPDASYTANVLIPLCIARNAGGRKLAFFSSDQVYSGHGRGGPFTEADVAPGNTYARHKLEMERRTLDECPDAVLLRAEWMYDTISPRGNYIISLLNSTGPFRYGREEHRGITYLKEVAENMEAVLSLPGGAYNFGSETTRPMYDITCDILRFIGKDAEVCDSGSARDLWMDCGKARAGGVVFSEVLEALKRCVTDAGRAGV